MRTNDTTTTVAPSPVAVHVVLTQPSHGDRVRVIGGQSAPLEYVLTVTNSGDTPSGPIEVTDTPSACAADLEGKEDAVANVQLYSMSECNEDYPLPATISKSNEAYDFES